MDDIADRFKKRSAFLFAQFQKADFVQYDEKNISQKNIVKFLYNFLKIWYNQLRIGFMWAKARLK